MRFYKNSHYSSMEEKEKILFQKKQQFLKIKKQLLNPNRGAWKITQRRQEWQGLTCYRCPISNVLHTKGTCFLDTGLHFHWS